MTEKQMNDIADNAETLSNWTAAGGKLVKRGNLFYAEIDGHHGDFSGETMLSAIHEAVKSIRHRRDQRMKVYYPQRGGFDARSKISMYAAKQVWRGSRR